MHRAGEGADRTGRLMVVKRCGQRQQGRVSPAPCVAHVTPGYDTYVTEQHAGDMNACIATPLVNSFGERWKWR